MRKPIVNRFSLSYGSVQTWNRCHREWWWRKVGAWTGWDWNAPHEARLAYRLSKMQSLSGLVDKSVRSVIKALVKQPTLPLPEALEIYDALMRKGYRESRGGAWERDPKWRTNLFEHYYGALDPERAKKLYDHGVVCLENLYRQVDLLDLVKEVEDPELKVWDHLFEYEVPADPPAVVWGHMDLVLVVGEDAYLWSLRTGKERTDHEVAVLIYALGLRRRGRAADTMRGSILYLGEPSGVEIPVSDAVLDSVEKALIAKAVEMRGLLPNPEVNHAPKEAFEPTCNTALCKHCEFFEMCSGHRDVAGAEELAAA